ncbi:DUF1876 domain-containing protein [Microbispora sp. RL4-1S]|uniref:DUF1876 domain-containing protein n=1 Tax=Microbispora oryzae TaxID=2806554 RepID=A0A940WLZ5_9ACTN|nr:DUF1876 domain-containing protein [Microbispora oryzae]MBP2703920.1 DUF1876 domain-containing protein [Microbispora oryzae]
MEAKQWNVQIFISEEGDATSARAVLSTGNGGRLTGDGHAKRNPADRPVAEIGDELAVARALGDLADKLMATTSQDIAAAASSSRLW